MQSGRLYLCRCIAQDRCIGAVLRDVLDDGALVQGAQLGRDVLEGQDEEQRLPPLGVEAAPDRVRIWLRCELVVDGESGIIDIVICMRDGI